MEALRTLPHFRKTQGQSPGRYMVGFKPHTLAGRLDC